MALPAKAIRRSPVLPSSAAPKLKVVRPPRKQRARVPFFALCLAILIGAMLGALVLNTAMASTAYEMHSTGLELARTLQNNQEQAAQVDRLSSPSRLAEEAKSLGMVPGEGITYIDLEAGTLVGSDANKAKES